MPQLHYLKLTLHLKTNDVTYIRVVHSRHSWANPINLEFNDIL